MTTEDTAKPRPRLVVFDVEGVLIPKRRYLLFEASEKLGFRSFLKILFTGFLYEIGLISIESTLKKIFRLFRGLSIDDLQQLYRKIPLIAGVQRVFEELRRFGCKTALISSGLPQRFVEDLASRLDADYACGLDLEVVEGRLSGEIGGDVIEPEGKALALRKILEWENLTGRDCAVVADDRNNLPMFEFCELKIGYNPDFLLSQKSDFVVKGDLSEVLPRLTGDSRGAPRSTISKSEIFREAIHIGGFLVPFISIYLLNRYLVAFALFLVTLLYTASELARMRGINFPVASTITWSAATKPEMYEFVTAPIFFAVGIMFALVFFPEPVSYASIAILTLGDGFATLFGKWLGRKAFIFNKGKRIEGTVFGFTLAFLGASLFVDPLKALVGAAVGMFAECLPTPISDNLTIPLASGIVLMLTP